MDHDSEYFLCPVFCHLGAGPYQMVYLPFPVFCFYHLNYECFHPLMPQRQNWMAYLNLDTLPKIHIYKLY